MSEHIDSTETSKTKNKAVKHGLWNHPLYKVYYGMKNRCKLKSNISYKYYGGRGIRVCDEWESDFMAFYQWAINNGYKKGLSLDRIDNDGNYCPENCRWVDRIKQNSNRRANVFITHNGETHTVAEWSRITGINMQTMLGRIKSGWPVDEIFGAKHIKNTDGMSNKPIKTAVYKEGVLIGVFKSQTSAAEALNIDQTIISRRLRGMNKPYHGYTFKRYEEVAT